MTFDLMCAAAENKLADWFEFLLCSFQFRVLTIFLSLSSLMFAQVPASSPVQPAETDLIHYGDLIDVDFVGSVDYDWRGSINPEGFLDGLELASERIYALCKSEDAIAAEIAKQYSKTLRNPKVVVKILDRSGRAVALLLGAVKNPQRFSIKRRARLGELLALSGGITDRASGEVTMFRPGNTNCSQTESSTESGKSFVMHLTLSKLLSGDSEANPVILSGDIITVVQASPIYVIGGVNNPRQLASKEELTVSHAISAAGGLAKEAVESDVTIYRRDGKETKSFSIDLNKIRSKQQDDVVLKPFDIVDVGQKGRAKPKFPPVIDAETENRNLYKLPIRPIE
jgi:protein involved in polysaccharide export with SLBB domain